MNRTLENIAIVGGGLHSWVAAARLSAALKGQKVKISVIGDSPDQSPGVLSLGLEMHAFHAAIGLSEPQIVREIGGCYKYGIAYQNWTSDGLDFIYGYSPVGQMINRIDFHFYVAQLKLAGKKVSLEPFSVPITAASEQRFSHPESGTPLEKIDYAMQVDRNRYQQFLQAYSLRNGVKHIPATVESVARDNQSGQISELVLSDGQTINADFYFDASPGQTARLFDDELNANFTSWSHWFPCDRRVESVYQSNTSTALTNIISRTEHGWQQVIPMPGVSYREYSYCHEQLSDDEAIKEVEQMAGAKVSPQMTNVLAQRVGARDAFWVANCVALGDAAGFAESLYFNQLSSTIAALDRWLDLYPSRQVDSLLREQYNRSTVTEYRHLCDVHALRLATAEKRRGDALTRLTESEADGRSQIGWPESLQHRIELFRHTGRVAFYEEDILHKHQWVSMLIGCGVWPQRIDPLLEVSSLEELEAQMSSLVVAAKKVVAELPKHDALLQALRQATPAV